jgi:hypothetical protein
MYAAYLAALAERGTWNTSFPVGRGVVPGPLAGPGGLGVRTVAGAAVGEVGHPAVPES